MAELIKIKGVTYSNRDKKWQSKIMVDGKDYFIGYSRSQYHANCKLQRFKNTFELKLILKYVNDLSGIDIATKDRHKPLPFFRALFTRIAFNVINDVSLQEIANVLKNDHSTVHFYKKELIPEISNIHDYNVMYLNYPLVDDNKVFIEINKVEKLKTQIQILLNINKQQCEKLNEFEDSEVLTANEIKYRKLSKEKQKEYDFKVQPILIMLNIKDRKEESKYEKIKCHA